MKIANVIGARPQFIKYVPVSRAIEKANGNAKQRIDDILVHTGQHYDYEMSKVFFDEFGIRAPDHHLGVGSGSQGAQTGQIIERVEGVLVAERPDLVLVYGDTNSTLGAALAAAKLHIPVAHVEAGLRSHNRRMSEEINRVLTDHISSILFCPTQRAVENLRKEGFHHVANNGHLITSSGCPDADACFGPMASDIIVANVGDVMYDLLLFAVSVAREKSAVLNNLQLDGKDYYLLTMHRAENTDDTSQFEKLIDFVNEACSGKTVVFPMHPRTRKMYHGLVRKRFAENIRIIDPVGYFDVIMLLEHCRLLMTDSGGMQKEAYWLKIPCVTLRDETEWVETIESGWNVLYKNYDEGHKGMRVDQAFYGDGRAAERIINVLADVPFVTSSPNAKLKN